MPKFYRSNRRKTTTPTRRTFVGHSVRRKIVPSSVVLTSEIKPDLKEKLTPKEQPSSTITSLYEMLSKHKKPENPIATPQNEETDAVFRDEVEVDEFNGVSNLEEQENLYGTAIEYQKKKSKVVEEQIRLIEEEREKERRELEGEIKELRKELHRTAPLHDTKFFSLSKELKEAIAEIESVVGPNNFSPGIQNEVRQVPLPPESLVSPKMVTKPPAVETPTTSVEVKSEIVPPEVVKKNLPKKKMLITGASAAILLVAISSVVTWNLGTQAKVDKKIVEAYLATQASETQTSQATGSVAGSTTSATDASQAEVSFDQSVWEEFNDPVFGVMLQYPKNAVKAIRTDSNITFVRKTGYLFKIQRIETSLTLDDYWKQIKPTSLNYMVAQDLFKGKAALKLALEDMSDYPGDRILVKNGGFIYDVWYATPSTTFTQDDMKRVEKMLASLSIVGGN